MIEVGVKVYQAAAFTPDFADPLMHQHPRVPNTPGNKPTAMNFHCEFEDSDHSSLFIVRRHLVVNIADQRDSHLGAVVAAKHIADEMGLDLHLYLQLPTLVSVSAACKGTGLEELQQHDAAHRTRVVGRKSLSQCLVQMNAIAVR